MLETRQPIIQNMESDTRLKKLADALGCDISIFTQNKPHDLFQTNELLLLWHKLKDKQDRVKLLVFMHSIIEGP